MTQVIEPTQAALRIERFGPGEQVRDPQPGDFILTHGRSFYSQLIRVGQSLRFWGADRKYARWNHAAMIIDRNGTIIEALGTGVTQRSIADYTPTEYYVVRIKASDEDRQEAVRFAQYCLQTEQRYAWLEIVSIALSLLTGAKLRFGIDGEEICSGLVAKALERTSAIFEKESSHMMPADLAKYYHVEPPPPQTDKGQAPAVKTDGRSRQPRWSKDIPALGSLVVLGLALGLGVWQFNKR